MSKVDYSRYEQVQCERDITSGNFVNGQQNWQFDTDGVKYWNPYRSYFRVRCQLTRGDGTELLASDDVAPNMFMMDNIYSQICAKCCGKEISSIQDYIAQVGALSRRMKISDSVLENMDELMMSSPDIDKRFSNISSDGKLLDEEIIKPIPPDTTIASTVALPSGFLGQGGFPNMSILGIRANAQVAAGNVQQNHGVATSAGAFTVGGYLVVGDSFVLGEHIYTVQTRIGDNTAVVTPCPNQDLAATTWSKKSGSVAQRTVTGVNTQFTTTIVSGDELEIEGKRGFFVESVTNDTTLLLRNDPNLTVAIATTGDWRRIRKRTTRQAGRFELIWKPPLGLFDVDSYLQGKWKIEMLPIPSSSFKQYAVESLSNKQPGTTALTYDFQIVSMLFYPCIGYKHGAISGSYNIPLSFMDCRAQSQNLTTNTLTDKTFVVNPNTRAITLAYQDELVASNQTDYSRSFFKIRNDEELNLQRFYIKFKGQILPNPIPDPSKVDLDFTDYTAQNYYEQLMYSGAKPNKPDFEPLEKWKKRGAFYNYKFDSVSNKSERCYVSSQFSALTASPQVFIFDHFLRSHVIKIVDGYAQDCRADQPPN
jgi:hypothetical protein